MNASFFHGEGSFSDHLQHANDSIFVGDSNVTHIGYEMYLEKG